MIPGSQRIMKMRLSGINSLRLFSGEPVRKILAVSSERVGYRCDGCHVIYLLATSPRRNLDRFLRQVATVEIGTTKLTILRAQLERMHLSSFKPESCLVCNQQNCATVWHVGPVRERTAP